MRELRDLLHSPSAKGGGLLLLIRALLDALSRKEEEAKSPAEKKRMDPPELSSPRPNRLAGSMDVRAGGHQSVIPFFQRRRKGKKKKKDEDDNGDM